MAKPSKEQLTELAAATLRNSLDWDSCVANARMLADEFSKYDMTTATADVILKSFASKGYLSKNAALESAFTEFFRRSEFADIESNRNLLKKIFQFRSSGKYNNSPITVEALESQAGYLSQNGMLAKSQQAIAAERETQRQIAAATRDVQDQVKMINELLSVWKISKNPYSSAPGEITQKIYDQKEAGWYALPLDQLRVKYAEVMEKRAMRNMTPAELKTHVRAQAEEFKTGSQNIERYLPLPKQLVFSPEIHPRIIDADLIRWIAANDIERYKHWIEKYGSENLSARLDGRD